MSYNISDIDWKTDGFTVPELPQSIVVWVDVDEDDVSGYIANFLSDEYGWLVNGFFYCPE